MDSDFRLTQNQAKVAEAARQIFTALFKEVSSETTPKTAYGNRIAKQGVLMAMYSEDSPHPGTILFVKNEDETVDDLSTSENTLLIMMPQHFLMNVERDWWVFHYMEVLGWIPDLPESTTN